MELHQLQYVIEIAKHNHFTRAAEEICVSQSTLSQQVTKLEEELGVKLFDRTTRAVRPTPAGEEFIHYAKRILSDIERAKNRMHEYAGLSKGKIKIGTINSMSNLATIIVNFRKDYPGLNIMIVEEGSYKLLEMLQTFQIDIAIVTPPVEMNLQAMADIYELIDDDLVLVTSKNHPLAKRDKIDLAEAAQEKFIFPSRTHSAYNLALQACRDANFDPDIICESSSLYSRFDLVSKEMGVSLVSSKGVKSSDTDKVTTIALTKSIKKPTVLALLKHTYHPPAVIAFRDYILNSVSFKQT